MSLSEPAGAARRSPRLPLWADLLAMAALGALQSLAFIHTEAWALQWAAVGVLAWRVAQATPKSAAALGWAFGCAWLLSGTWWLFISLHRYGELPAWLAALAVLVLCSLLSLYLAMSMALFARWRSPRTDRAGRDALLFAAVWMLAELARAVIFTGFPWVASGYAHVDGPLAALAPWVGVYGIGFVAAWLAAWLAFTALNKNASRRQWLLPLAAIGVTLLVGWAGPPTFTQPTGTLSVSLIQGNIPQEEKFAAERQGAALVWHIDTLMAAQGDLVIAPETASPLLPQQLPAGLWAGLNGHFQQGRTHAIVGVPLGDDEAGYTNSAVGFAPGRSAYRYDKHHLVPFGEFIPWGFKWFTRMMNIPLGDFNRGPLSAPSFGVNGERVAPNICYEDLFGEELAARFTDAASAPTIFANISNIGWFGDSIAVAQHLHLSRLRTLEFQVPMLRATNTGATAVIDHHGVVTHSLPPHQRGVLNGSVQGRSGLTPFAWWAAHFGLWPLLALAAAVLLWCWRGARP